MLQSCSTLPTSRMAVALDHSTKKTLVDAAMSVLREADPVKKAERSFQVAEAWKQGYIADIHTEGSKIKPLDRPARDDEKVKLVAPKFAPKRKKGATLSSRQALLHSLVHIESWAVDLSWDVIARFGAESCYHLPRDFFDDFVKVAEDESRHFVLLRQRLEAIGSSYGAFAAHDGLWESAMRSAHSLPARLAVEHCVHEARGLDVMPSTIDKFRNNGDAETAALLEDIVYPEEITHCAAGVRWLKYLHQYALSATKQNNVDAINYSPWICDAQQYGTVEQWFHALVCTYFKGRLKPPFNVEARSKAGFDENWYLPLSVGPPAFN